MFFCTCRVACSGRNGKTYGKYFVVRGRDYRSRWGQAEACYVGQLHWFAFFHDSTARFQQLKASTRSFASRCTIPSGERYVIYRVDLYSDSFQQNKSTRQWRSGGGVYLIPLGLSRFELTSNHAVRVLCLTPHGCPMAPVLQRIIDDHFTVATDGIRGVDHDSRLIRIFIDEVSMMGYPSQAAAFTDILRHSASTLCTPCCM